MPEYNFLPIHQSKIKIPDCCKTCKNGKWGYCDKLKNYYYDKLTVSKKTRATIAATKAESNFSPFYICTDFGRDK